MSIPKPAAPLRTLLLLDAATCAVMGAALVLGAGAIAGLTAIPSALLLYAGLALLPVAAFMAVVAGRAARWPAGVRLVIAGNAAWVAGSLALIAGGWIAPNALGAGFIAVQALAVAGLAALETVALRRATVAAAA